MKVAAHPLVVAVALGLVGPQVLEEVEPETRPKATAGCDAEPEGDALDEAIAVLQPELHDTTLNPTSDWTNAPAPSPEDFARVAEAFEKARTLV